MGQTLSIIKLIALELNQENYFSDTTFILSIELLMAITINILLKFVSKNERKNNENFNKKNSRIYLISNP